MLEPNEHNYFMFNEGIYAFGVEVNTNLSLRKDYLLRQGRR